MTAKGRTTVIEMLQSWTCAIGYALHRGRVAGARLSRLVLAAGMVAALWAGLSGLRRGLLPLHVVIAAAGISICVMVVWSERRGFLVFVPEDGWNPSEEPDLAAERMMTVRGSGIFAVGDRERQFVEAPVTFWTTRLDEHVLAAYVRPFRLAGLVGVPEDERGWWYAFIHPREVRQLTAGVLIFRGRRRRALQLVLSRKQRSVVTYLSCDDEATARTLEHEIRRPGRLAEPEAPDAVEAQDLRAM